MKAPKEKKPKFPFWVLRLTNVQIYVLLQAMDWWLFTATGRCARPDEVAAAEHLHKALTTTREKRLARIKDPLA